MRAIVLLNRKAGTLRTGDSSAVVNGIARAFAEAGAEARVRVLHPKAFAGAIEEALKEGQKLDALIIGGGDGSLSHAARALAGTPLALGVIPLGTLNLFARGLHLPLDPVEAAAALSNARVWRVDMLQINGVGVLQHASIGLQPQIIRLREAMTHETRFGKMWKGALAWIKVLRRVPLLRISARTDGAAIERTTPAMLISNNPLPETPGAALVSDRLAGGKIGLYICTSSARRDLVALTLAVPLGAWRTTGLVEEIVAAEAEIQASKRRLLLSIDGELMHFRPPLKCSVARKCLSVLFPPEAPEPGGGKAG